MMTEPEDGEDVEADDPGDERRKLVRQGLSQTGNVQPGSVGHLELDDEQRHRDRKNAVCQRFESRLRESERVIGPRHRPATQQSSERTVWPANTSRVMSKE